MKLAAMALVGLMMCGCEKDKCVKFIVTEHARPFGNPQIFYSVPDGRALGEVLWDDKDCHYWLATVEEPDELGKCFLNRESAEIWVRTELSK